MICAKTGPLTNLQAPAALILVQDLGAGDVRRHEVRGELDALEVQVQDVGERLDEERLRQPRHAGDQAVAAGEQRDEHLLDDLVLPDDDLAELGENARAAFGNSLGRLGRQVGTVHMISSDRRTGQSMRGGQCVRAYTISLMPMRYAIDV